MALEFAGSTKVVNCGSGDSLDNHQACTILAWVYPIAMLNDSRIVEKGGTNFRCNLGTGNVELIVDLATTDITLISTTGQHPKAGTWQLVGCSYVVGGAATDHHLYLGGHSGPMTELTYATRTGGSGALTSNAATSLLIGNRTGDSRDWGGYIAQVLVFNRQLCLAEIEDFRRTGRVPAGCVLNQHLGHESSATAQLDLTGNGNHGTVTAATKVPHPTFLRPVRGWRRPDILWIDDAGGGSFSDAAGSSTLTFAVSAGGSSLADAAAASTFTFTVTGAGSSLADADGASAFVFAASAGGSSLVDGAGASTFVFAASGIGSSLADAAGSTTLTFTVSGASDLASFGDGAGSASMAFSVSGVGSALADGAGSSSVTFVAAGVGSSLADGAGSSALAFVVTGVSDYVSPTTGLYLFQRVSDGARLAFRTV